MAYTAERYGHAVADESIGAVLDFLARHGDAYDGIQRYVDLTGVIPAWVKAAMEDQAPAVSRKFVVRADIRARIRRMSGQTDLFGGGGK